MSEDLSSGEEQSAAAALLGLHTAWPSSPDDESRDDGSEEHNPEGLPQTSGTQPRLSAIRTIRHSVSRTRPRTSATT